MPKFDIQLRADGATFEVEAPDEETASQTAAQLHRLSAQGGLSDEDIDYLVGGKGHQAEANPNTGFLKNLENPALRAGAGALRAFDRISQGAQQLVASPDMVRAGLALTGAAQQGVDLETLGISEDELKERQDEIGMGEAMDREIFSQLDDAEGLFGTTIGMEDVGEFAVDAIPFVAGGGVLNMAARGSLLAGLQASTPDENRLANMAVAGILGIAIPGAAQAVTGGVRNAAFLTRAGIGLAGTIAGIRGFGRATTFIAKLGGIARREQMDAAIAQKARDQMIEAADRLRPIIQGMSQRQVKDVQRQSFRDFLASNFKKNLMSVGDKEGRFGLDVAKFVQDIDDLADSTLRSKLGKTWGDEIVGYRAYARTVAEAIDRTVAAGKHPDLSNLSFAQGLINGIHEYIGSARWDAVKNLRTPKAREQAHLQHFRQLTNAMITQKEPDETVGQ